jgi:DNA-binding IclR family transcriptional regulator
MSRPTPHYEHSITTVAAEAPKRKRYELPKAKASGTQAIERASLLIRLIASHSRSGLLVGEIAALVTLERTTVHRILKCLVSEGLAMRAADTHRYFLGPLAFELGLAAAPRFNLAHICSPWLHRIAEKTGDTVFLMVRSAYDSVCIDRQDGSFPIKTFTMDVGARRPLGVGAGSLAMMLRLPNDAIDEILSANADRLATQYGLSVPSALKALKRSREMGYGLNEFQKGIGVTTLSLPIVNRFGHPFAAISIGAITSRMNGVRQKELISILRTEIPLLEKAFGEMRQQ